MVELFFETTAEKDLVINNRELKYKGIFHIEELFATINRALEERGYQKREKKTEELVTETSRKTYLELRPYKVKSEYLALMLKMKIHLDHIQETVETQEQAGIPFQQGTITIYFDAWLLTDWEQRWNMSPVTFFLKGFINKFLYVFPLEAGARGELAGDTAYVYARVKKLLNSYLPVESRAVREEDIRKQVEEEIATELKEGAE